MRIMVIGGSGFIGSHIVKLAREQDHEVDSIDIVFHGDAQGQRYWDIRNEDMQSFPLSGYDLVIMEAALTSQLENNADLFDTNVKGLFNVLEACRKSKVSKVVYASSSAIYGNMTDAPCPTNLYGASKLIGEHLMEAYTRKEYFGGVILRYFNVYGIGEKMKGPYQSIISLFLEQIARSKCVDVYGDGNQSRDFINVRDVARITLELGMKHSGTYNIGTGRPTSWNEILDIFRKNGLEFETRYVANPIKDYQTYTQADMYWLNHVGVKPAIDIEQGIKELIEARLS